MRRRTGQSGAAALEYVIVYAGVVMPLTFMLVFTAQLLWVWNGVIEFTRDGARYAATHCWQGAGSNVQTYMRANVPQMIDMDQFQNGEADLQVAFKSREADTGQLIDFTCDGAECSAECVPDAVTVSVANYQFRRFFPYLGLPAVTIPDFQTTLPIESAGCDPEQGTCLP